jgi:hypothetical protein
VTLFTNCVRLPYPISDLRIKLVLGIHAQLMSMPQGGIGGDFSKPAMLLPAGKLERAEQVRFARNTTEEAHAYLKHDTRSLRGDDHRSAGTHHLCELVEYPLHMRLTVRKQHFESKLPAGVPHIPGD